MLYIRSV